MSTRHTPDKTIKSPSRLTLAQLLDHILADAELDQVKRQDVASALRSLAKALRQPTDVVLADPIELRRRLANYTPAMAGVSAGRWRNIRSLLQFALERADIVRLPGRSRQKPSAAWSVLLADLTTYGDRYKLSRFARWCSGVGIEPDGVDDAGMTSYLEDLQQGSLVAEPNRVQRDVAVVWNRCAAEIAAWPQQRLTVPNNKPTYAIPWTAFPASLTADVEAWLDRLAGTDRMAEWDFRPLKPASLVTRKKQIHLFISALVLQGEDPARLNTLADVVTPERVGKGLTFFWSRAGSAASVHGGQIAGVLRSVAKHWVGADDAQLKRLRLIARRITPEATGMTARNRERLRPLDEKQNLHALLMLPERIKGDVLRLGKPTHTLALDLQSALAIELLIMVPIRMGNLNRLRCGLHLIRGLRGNVTLALAEHEVKNRVPVEARLPDSTVELLDLYESHYRPLLSAANSDWLFPGQRADAPKSSMGFRQQLQKCIRTRCGLTFHPHLFRHAAAKLILEANPGAHGQVQRVLGHKTMATTLAYYTGLETKAAVEHYDKQVIRLRDDARLLPPSPSGRKRRR